MFFYLTSFTMLSTRQAVLRRQGLTSPYFYMSLCLVSLFI